MVDIFTPFAHATQNQKSTTNVTAISAAATAFGFCSTRRYLI